MKNASLIFLFLWIFTSPLLIAQTPQWANTTKSAGMSDHDANHIKIDQAGNIYVAGNFEYTLKFSHSDFELSGIGGGNSYLYKNSPSGELLWAIAMGGVEINDLMDMAIDQDGNIYLVGQYRGDMAVGSGGNSISISASGMRDGYIAKYSPSGALLGAHTVGGTARDGLHALGFDADNNIVLAGNFTGEVDFDLSENSHIEDCTGLTLVKYTADFELISVHKLSSSYAQISNIAVNAEGEIIFGGYFRESVMHESGAGITGGPQYTDLGFLMKLSTTYEFEWVGGVIGTAAQYIRDIQPTPSGAIYITGDISNTATFISNDGTQTMETNAGSRDVFFAKITSAGVFEWIKTMGGAGTDLGSSLDLDNAGNIVLVGSYFQTMDFDPGSGTAEYTSEGSSSSYVSIYTPDGAYINTFTFDNPDGNAASGIALNANNEIYLTGKFKYSIDFDSAQPGFAFTSMWEDSYLLKMSSVIVGMDEAHGDHPISIFPNPTNTQVKIKGAHLEKIECFDIHGKLVFSKSPGFRQNEHTISVSHLPAAIYFIRLSANNQVSFTEKLVITR